MCGTPAIPSVSSLASGTPVAAPSALESTSRTLTPCSAIRRAATSHSGLSLWQKPQNGLCTSTIVRDTQPLAAAATVRIWDGVAPTSNRVTVPVCLCACERLSASIPRRLASLWTVVEGVFRTDLTAVRGDAMATSAACEAAVVLARLPAIAVALAFPRLDMPPVVDPNGNMITCLPWLPILQKIRLQRVQHMGTDSDSNRTSGGPLTMIAPRRSRSKSESKSKSRSKRSHAPGVFITGAYAHDSTESCVREALRTRHERSPLEHRGYHHTMVTAADPSHFRKLLLAQGGWSPPPPGGAPLGVAPRVLPPSIVAALRRDCDRTRATMSGSAPLRTIDDVVRAVSAHMSEHKRGIFVSVRGGRVVSYQPFSLFRYRNRSIPPDAMASASDDPDGGRRWLQDPSTWFVNHCFLDLRPQTRINPPEWWTVEYFELLRRWERWDGVPEAAREGIHADFIINNSDYPVIRLGKGGLKGSPRLPVVGATRHADYADIAVPTQDDIEALTGKVFLHLSTRQACKRDSFTPANRAWADVPWELRAPTAVFRGSANGCGTTTDDNARLKLALVAQTAQRATDEATSPPLLDVGITDWSNWAPRRPDPVGRPGVVRKIDVAGLPFELSGAIPFRRQAAYKYIVNVEGYVAAFRYPHLLDSGSVVINVRSAYGLWFEPAVVPGEHVIEVRNPSEVPDAVRALRADDEGARRIAGNALALHRDLIRPHGPALEYMTLLLTMLLK